MPQNPFPGFRYVPRTGVIYVMNRAAQLGFSYDHPEWANLGQGAPEAGELPGAPPRITEVHIDTLAQEYTPVAGLKALRQKVADFYNAIYRQGKSSQYTWENVCISGGGRQGLTRVVAALGEINIGHFIPDYTAYEEMLHTFRGFIPIPIQLPESEGFKLSQKLLKEAIQGMGLGAVLFSNPCNPTGQVIEGQELQDWVALFREEEVVCIVDEFYSHYLYNDYHPDTPRMISAAACVEDVNKDPVVIVDGLTKNWRYPGWRVSWTLAPKSVVELISSAGSFLDGGANHPLQKKALELLDPDLSRQETQAIQRSFMEKRSYALKRLREMGIEIALEPQGSFYVWANLENLPEAINDGIKFFEAGLLEKVITVPGVFFDVNPGKRRRSQKFRNYTRISFGPEMSKVQQGLDAIERVVRKHC
ncbi:pyridoxal phosphate-dependent aminotransferase [bacterium (Candidatus Blackallbacteria) CG17_big_fil_post_rev_8_21_14_2_50_48_46]|uniref:Pyridoxal phosphate-dependent aminotransferase n=1 Tax=bacterium (Candidatus Blackallbacteria) CG17_big_fil_post_rev_8_21_14_2_50_48_46 TaxID=2014261 RepID=A0A2M7G8T0_9BACT|nr:MAG: aspartate aminotransferase [bacterium (Candidatus Blackallbacteria) CG18_big_fil_WC_8_21_14_2_50_49_26]PIW18518.1 MAG: pyridoxal phosphate-dependent aminotransferase [bacterium (Candidatus Blackallbacteria) CG17_big_fil_post_rev_8_21_14_2_50_48_46]PIW46497.1 MAG: pyridoxal phosphate-dependent aminotransferase [bacterium (Candidatus Blackallbacteria) CG13_big_fil_rev_8_21_14_2_50_49_14]